MTWTDRDPTAADTDPRVASAPGRRKAVSRIAGRQVGISGHYRVHGVAQPVLIEPTAQRDIELHRIHIVACRCAREVPA